MDNIEKRAWAILARRSAKFLCGFVLVIAWGFGVVWITRVIADSEYAEFAGKALTFGMPSALVVALIIFFLVRWKDKIKAEITE